ncbi:hypothetical protein BC628DRAFT_1418263 [Trametes gibbosa]|nr:hypothetical protein BC628DRAFT_1418263 [Trametes gibbosa]
MPMELSALTSTPSASRLPTASPHWPWLGLGVDGYDLRRLREVLGHLSRRVLSRSQAFTYSPSSYAPLRMEVNMDKLDWDISGPSHGAASPRVGLVALSSYSDVHPLLFLHTLSALVIKPSIWLPIDNCTLSVIAAAWPAIRRLQLCPMIIQHGLGTRQRRPSSVGLGRSPITDPVAVAAFLSDLFPKLWNIDCDFAFEEYAREDDVREEERARILQDAEHRLR